MKIHFIPNTLLLSFLTFVSPRFRSSMRHIFVIVVFLTREQRETETGMKYRLVTLCILSFFHATCGTHILRSLERTTHLILDVRDFTVFLFRGQCFISATRSLSLNDKWHDGERVRVCRYSSFRSRYTSSATTEINQRCCINPFSPLLFYHRRIAS